jgi:hypothetical protein
MRLLAYSPLDQGRFAAAPENQKHLLESMAKKYGATVAQVVLAWLYAHGPVTPIVRTTNPTHLAENITAQELLIERDDIDEIDATFPVDIIDVPTEAIRVIPEGEWGHDVYTNVDEAIENAFGFVPSPAELATEVQSGDFLKPVRVVPSSHPKYEYDLIGGRIRYWAWVIAHDGQLPIAVQVRSGL